MFFSAGITVYSVFMKVNFYYYYYYHVVLVAKLIRVLSNVHNYVQYVSSKNPRVFVGSSAPCCSSHSLHVTETK